MNPLSTVTYIYGALQLIYQQSTPSPLDLKSFEISRSADNSCYFDPTVYIDPRTMAILAACHYHQMSREIGVTLPLNMQLFTEERYSFVQKRYPNTIMPSRYKDSMGFPMLTYEGKILGPSAVGLPD